MVLTFQRRFEVNTPLLKEWQRSDVLFDRLHSFISNYNNWIAIDYSEAQRLLAKRRYTRYLLTLQALFFCHWNVLRNLRRVLL